MWMDHENSYEPFILASSPNSAISERLELFLKGYDRPLKFELQKVKFEVYQKMRIVDFEDEPTYGIALN